MARRGTIATFVAIACMAVACSGSDSETCESCSFLFRDDFAGTQPSSWVDGNATFPPGTRSTVEPVGGELVVTMQAGESAHWRSGVLDIRGQSFVIEVLAIPEDSGIQVEFGLLGRNFVDVGFYTFGGALTLEIDTDPAVLFDPTAHRWWRIRECDGTCYLETSPDGASWTTQRAEPVELDPATDEPQLYIGVINNGAPFATGEARFDNLNLPPECP